MIRKPNRSRRESRRAIWPTPADSRADVRSHSITVVILNWRGGCRQSELQFRLHPTYYGLMRGVVVADAS